MTGGGPGKEGAARDLRREARTLRRVIRTGQWPGGDQATLAEETRAAADLRAIRRLLQATH